MPDSLTIQEIPCETWDEVEQAHQQIMSHNPTHWVFRGQARSDWTLSSSLERAECPVGLDFVDAEKYLLDRFRRQAPSYFEGFQIDDLEDDSQALALMQHYGCPTRLLDFTRSFRVAMFFALESRVSCARAVWACDKDDLTDHAAGQLFMKHPINSQEHYRNMLVTGELALFHNLDILNSDPLHCVFPVEAKRIDRRMRTQQGLFLCPGNLNNGFYPNLEAAVAESAAPEGMARALKKLVIDEGVREEGLEKLAEMNIDRYNLFPGLDGFAQSLVQDLNFSLDGMDYTIRTQGAKARRKKPRR